MTRTLPRFVVAGTGSEAGGTTVVIAAPTGAAAGVARLLGADLVSPDGATGFADTDLAAKADVAERLITAGEHALLVVHIGAIDEAGHARDAELQHRATAAFDRELVGSAATTAHATGVPLWTARFAGSRKRRLRPPRWC